MSQSKRTQRHIHFVTGKLAQSGLQRIVEELSKKLDFHYSIGVMPITVAALMTTKWLKRHLEIPAQATEVLFPGFVGDALHELQEMTHARLVVGPKDYRDLPEFFGEKKTSEKELNQYSIEIIAEINHAPRYSIEALLEIAEQLRSDGADVVDIGCNPGETWNELGLLVRECVARGIRVSVDSFDHREVAEACQNGAELVLSVNSQNVEMAPDWGTEVVVIPDTPRDVKSLDASIDKLQADSVPFRIDPILEPIGCGFTESIVRYRETRRRYAGCPMMMGIGNITELTDVDSAGINMLLMGICEELGIDSVLTTQVINWAKTSVRECDRARRIVRFAVDHQTPPKRVNDSLVIVRDARLSPFPREVLKELSQSIRDNNYRLFAQDGELHLVSSGLHLIDTDPFRLFDQLLKQEQSANVDATHAFYLGYELSKAHLALQLSKQYEQDQSLDWGYLTQPEVLHRLARARKNAERASDGE